MKKEKKDKTQKVIKEQDMSSHWNVKEFMPNIKVHSIDGFNYYFWSGLSKEAEVKEGSISEGDIVYRAQDLYKKTNVNSKFEYTFLRFDKGYALIRQSNYHHEKLVRPEELCKKDESTYARRKRIEALELGGGIFFNVDEKTQKKVNKRLNK